MVTINTLNGGNITITTSSVQDATKTRITFTNGSKGEYNISGTLNDQWFTNNNLSSQNIKEIDIGTTVSTIAVESQTFTHTIRMSIPENVIAIEDFSLYWFGQDNEEEIIPTIQFSNRTKQQVKVLLENRNDIWYSETDDFSSYKINIICSDGVLYGQSVP